MPRSEFISEGLLTDRLCQVVDVVRSKRSREASVSLVLPSGKEGSIWEEYQDALDRYLSPQADEASQVEIIRTDEPDWFTLAELEFSVESLPQGS